MNTPDNISKSNSSNNIIDCNNNMNANADTSVTATTTHSGANTTGGGISKVYDSGSIQESFSFEFF